MIKLYGADPECVYTFVRNFAIAFSTYAPTGAITHMIKVTQVLLSE